MDQRKETGPRVAAALVVAIGVATVWGLVLLWVGYFVSQFGQADYVYEQLEVLRDGTPVISSRSFTNWSDTTYRSLDGRLIEVDSEAGELPPAYFAAPSKPPGLYDNALQWPSRLAALVDYARPQASWYFVRDAEPVGHGYFIGYDELSKLLVGYISRAGYSRSLPTRDQWFDIGRRELDTTSGAITTVGQITYGSLANSYGGSAETRRMPPWVACLIDGDQVLEVDLRARALRKLYESAGLVATSVLYEEPAGIAKKQTVADQSKPAAGAADTKPDAEEDAPPKPSLQPRLAVRTTDRVIVINPPDGNKREFLLPDQLRDRTFSAYALPNRELLATSQIESDWRRNTLTWIRPDGSITRQQEVILAAPGEVNEQQAAWLAVPVAAVPAGWGIFLGVAGPLGMLQTHKATTYGDAIGWEMAICRWPLLAVVLIGAFLAWLTLRLQRKYRRPSSRVWATFVFLLGLPGFLAYLLEQRRTKLEACSQCGEIVPRDREACAACNKEFAPPAPVGTEIFA